MRHVAGVPARDRVAAYGTNNGAVPSLYVDVEPLSLDRVGFVVGDEVVVLSVRDLERLTRRAEVGATIALQTSRERVAKTIAEELHVPTVAHYSDAEWSRFIADHNLPEGTEIAFIDGAGRVVALPA